MFFYLCEQRRYLQLFFTPLTIDTNINQFIKVYHIFYKSQQFYIKKSKNEISLTINYNDKGYLHYNIRQALVF